MREVILSRISRAALYGVMVMSAAGASSAGAQTMLEQAAEHRFQLDFHVNDAALQKMLPAGWEPVIAKQGAAKDANLRMIFIDRVGIAGGDGKPTKQATSRLAYLAIPVKQSSGPGAGQMIIFGLTESAADAPGAFGTYQAASISKMSRSSTASGGTATGTEDWEFVGPAGERMEVHAEYERGPVSKGGGETKFYNPTDFQNGSGHRHHAQPNDQSARPCEEIFLQGGRRQDRGAV
jgi:hypothetical protein